MLCKNFQLDYGLAHHAHDILVLLAWPMLQAMCTKSKI